MVLTNFRFPRLPVRCERRGERNKPRRVLRSTLRTSDMKQPRSFPIGSVLFACLVAACSTKVSPTAIAWTDHLPVIGPPAEAKACNAAPKGCLRVYTGTDKVLSGSQTYKNVKRPFDLYASDGKLIKGDVNNQGGGTGEEPVTLPLAPGRYVVASVYGTTYRKVQVEIRAGVTTEVPASVLREASPVF
jgi:hypothetical protein